jgi:hypothetical protein
LKIGLELEKLNFNTNILDKMLIDETNLLAMDAPSLNSKALAINDIITLKSIFI